MKIFKAPGWRDTRWARGSCRSSGAWCSLQGNPRSPTYTSAAYVCMKELVWVKVTKGRIGKPLIPIRMNSGNKLLHNFKLQIQPVNDGSNGHSIGVLPLIPRQRGNVLRKIFSTNLIFLEFIKLFWIQTQCANILKYFITSFRFQINILKKWKCKCLEEM